MKRSTTAWLHGRKYEDVFTRDDDRDVPPGPDLSGVVYRLPLHLHVQLHLPFSTLLPENFARTLYFSARSTPYRSGMGIHHNPHPKIWTTCSPVLCLWPGFLHFE